LIEMEIALDSPYLQDLVNSLEMVGSKVMPQTMRAFKMASAVVEYTWKSYAMGAPIPGSSARIKNPTGGYARSIKSAMLSPFSRYIYSDWEGARFIEFGTKEYDMKKTHPFGARSRVTKRDVVRKGRVIRRKGEAYLIVPFRHGVPGTLSYGNIPSLIYNQIRQLIKSGDVQLSQVIRGRKMEENYAGELIPRKKYRWGSRIHGTGIDQIEGLVVMNTSTPRSQRSQYMTFRVISQNSPAFKWIQKAKPALNITSHVARNVMGIVQEIIESGLKKDLGLT